MSFPKLVFNRLSGLPVILITLFTVSFHSIKAAIASPRGEIIAGGVIVLP
jgi:hypothetical protein